MNFVTGWSTAILLGMCSWSANAAIMLFDFGINVDGTTTCKLGPCDSDGVANLSGIAGLDDSLFDYASGLGSMVFTITGIGEHSVDFFFDHEIDETTNTFFNEVGSAVGTPAAGQSWEIDEPGFVFGDLFFNFLDSTLDNGIGTTVREDVSMAMGWDFILGDGEQATISLALSEDKPLSGFYLQHSDPDSPAGSSKDIYFSSSLDIVPVPEPGVALLFGLGLIGIAASRRGRSRTQSK